jgi:hypothetical protein
LFEIIHILFCTVKGAVGETEYRHSCRRRVVQEIKVNEEKALLPVSTWDRKKYDSKVSKSKEFNVEQEMSRKHHIVQGQDFERDDCSSTSEFLRNGSLFINKPKTTNEYTSIKLNKGKELSHGQSFQQKVLNYEQQQVLSLTNNNNSKLGVHVPSWEERTGCFLVLPEDEKF